MQGQVRGTRKAASDDSWFKNAVRGLGRVPSAVARQTRRRRSKAMLSVVEALPDALLEALTVRLVARRRPPYRDMASTSL